MVTVSQSHISPTAAPMLGGPRAIDYYVTLVETSTPETFLSTIQAVGRAGSDAAVAALMTLLERHRDPAVWGIILETLGHIPTAASAKAIHLILTADGDQVDTVAVIEALAENGTDEAVAMIADLLTANARAQRHALRALADVGSAAAVNVLMAHISATPPDNARYMAKVRALARAPETADVAETAARFIIGLLPPVGTGVPSEQLQQALSELVQRFPQALAPLVQPVIMCLVEQEEEAHLGYRPLLKALDPDPYLAALREVAFFGGAADRAQRQRAIEVLGMFEASAVLGLMVAMLANRDVELAYAAQLALLDINDAAALRQIVTLFGHPRPEVRRRAVAACSGFTPQQVDAAVRPQLESANPMVCATAQRVLARFAPEQVLPRPPERRPGSRPGGSSPSRRPGSRPGSLPGSRPGGSPPSRRPGSGSDEPSSSGRRPGSRPGLLPGSRPGGSPPSRRPGSSSDDDEERRLPF